MELQTASVIYGCPGRIGMIYSNKVLKYFAKHPSENALAHICVGLGFGFLLTYPLAATHPVRWGAFFLVVGLLMHVKAMR